MRLCLALSLTLFATGLPGDASACPDIDGLLDWNCDGQVEVSMFGDSITYGTKDERRLGYPGRFRLLAPDVRVNNFGDPGERTANGKRRARAKFQERHDADLTIILEGVNDYFQSDRNASNTANNLKIMRDTARRYGALPFVGKLTQVRRDFQKGWVSSVNSRISSFATLDFFSLGSGILSSDKLHPNGRGYDRMAAYAYAKLQSLSNKNRPADRDGDGMYDFAERRYGANPTLADTDGDTISDGDEVFVYTSNPNSLDSDGDSLSDEYEVRTLGSNPGSASPGAPTLTALVPIS